MSYGRETLFLGASQFKVKWGDAYACTRQNNFYVVFKYICICIMDEVNSEIVTYKMVIAVLGTTCVCP